MITHFVSVYKWEKSLIRRTYAKPFILRSDTRPRVSLLARGRANSAIFA